MADVSVRPARPADAADIGRIQSETWAFGYATIVPAAVLASVTVEAATAAWADAVTNPPGGGGHHVLVAMEQTWVVGFVAVARATELQANDPDKETTALIGPVIVEPRWGRRGHASRLMAAAVEHARTDAMTRAISWIPEGDTVTREFLIGAGWAPDGLARALDTGAGELREIRLHVAL